MSVLKNVQFEGNFPLLLFHQQFKTYRFFVSRLKSARVCFLRLSSASVLQSHSIVHTEVETALVAEQIGRVSKILFYSERQANSFLQLLHTKGSAYECFSSRRQEMHSSQYCGFYYETEMKLVPPFVLCYSHRIRASETE